MRCIARPLCRAFCWPVGAAEIFVLGTLACGYAYAQSAAELILRADRLADQANWFKAAPLYAEAEKLFHVNGNQRDELYAKLGRLRGDVQKGSYKATRSEVVQELQNPLVESDSQLKLRALALLGNIDLNMNTEAALDDWRQVLSIATAAGDQKWQNRANGELGLVAGLYGNIGAAGVALYQAVSKADELGDVAGEVNFATWLANGMAVNGMADRSLQLLDRAAEVARKAGYDELPLQMSIAKIRAFLSLPEPQKDYGRREALKLLAATLKEAQQNGILGAQTELLTQAGQLSLEEHDYVSAEASFRKVIEIAKQASLPREEAEGLLHLSQIYRATNQLDKAAVAIDGAIQTTERVEEAYDLPTFIAEKAEVRAAMGSLKSADVLYDQATELIEGLLVNAQSSRVKTEMISAMSDIYVGHFRLDWNGLHDGEKAFKVIEDARGRALLDSIRYARQSGPIAAETSTEQAISRLQKRLLNAHLTAADTRRVLDQLDFAYFRFSSIEYTRSRKEMEMLRRPPVSLAALRRLLKPNESLVEFVLDQRSSYALQVTSSGLLVHVLPSRGQIDPLVNEFLGAVRRKQESTAYAQKLYQMLLAPIIRTGAIVLTIVPDGSLHLIPFGALSDETGSPISTRVIIGSAPSATIYDTLKTFAHQAIPTKPFLGVSYSPPHGGNTVPNLQSRGAFEFRAANLPPLEFARDEIADAAQFFGGASVTLDGNSASEAAVKAQPLAAFKILHFAAHAVGNESEPDRAALVLTPGNRTEDGLWQSREIRRARLNADVVVLSACETGHGRLEGEEGIMNLARAFLIAGAKSVVASLWSVDDRSTATVMDLFYKHLAAGVEVREALRQAQLEFIKLYGQRTQPYYWAGFEVIGDGTRRITSKAE